MNDEQNRFSHEVKLFFQSYLPNIKGLSPNTMFSYRDTLKFYFHFLEHRENGRKEIRTSGLYS